MATTIQHVPLSTLCFNLWLRLVRGMSYIMKKTSVMRGTGVPVWGLPQGHKRQ